jgi:L-threonylcarbamoyladenylate synthase
MKTIPIKEIEEHSEDRLAEICQALGHGELICLPCKGNYRLVADLMSEEAVSRLLQSKHRTHQAPSLVFLSDHSMLHQVTDSVDPVARQLASELWPGPLTILFSASPALPQKVVKQLSKANGRIGVRVPEDEIVKSIVKCYGRPLLVSSANREKKSGSYSPAQVRKNFMGQVLLFVDAGDLRPESASTVVSVDAGQVTITRPGAISQEKLASITG